MLQSHEKLLPCPPRPLIIDRRWKPTVELAPRCPRCDSANTKFCYYNNYSLTQPRYFCKGCRRYWTKGGSLRNVPVGGGCRKNRRGKSVRISSNSGGQNYGQGANRSGESTDDRAGSSAQSGSSNEATATSDASTIDLAAVYAKFLNHQPERDTGPTSVPELSGQFDLGSCYEFASDPSQQHSPVQFPSDLGLINCPVAVDDIPVTGNQFDHMDMPNISVQPERLVPEIACSDTMNYALQQPIGPPPDGVGPDIGWTNCAMEPEFNWQSPLSQGFESTMEDHLNFHSNFVNCNWGVYDLPQL